MTILQTPRSRFLGLAAALALPVAGHAQWLATPGTAAFGTAANWTGGTINGNFTGTSTITTLSVANDQQISTGGNIIFSGGSTPTYTLGLSANAGYFDMFSGASIQMLAGVTAPQIINAGFNQAGTTANKATIITASAVGQTLTINGNYNTQNSSGTIFAGLSNYLNLGGTGGIGIMNGILSDGRTAAGAAVLGNIIVKRQGTAEYTVNGVNTYTGGTEFGGGGTGNTVLGNNLALSTGAFRVVSGQANFSAGTTLTGASAIANTFNYVGSTGTSTSTGTTTFTLGSATATYTGTAPVVGGLVTGNALGFLPNYTRVVSVDTGAGTVTFDNVAGNSGSGTFSSALFNSSGGGTNTISGSNAIEFSGTQNLTTLNSNLTAGTQTFNITNSADTTFSGVLQQQGGTATVTKTGAGRLILSGANTYTGGTNINVGTVQVASSGALGSTGTILFGTGANNGTLQYTAANTTDYSNRFGTTANQNWNIDTNGQNVTFGSQMAPSSGGTFTKLGLGTLITTATNSNNLSGATTISAGTLQVGNGGTTGKLSNASAITNNGILVFNRSNGATQGTDFSSAAITGTGSLVQANSLTPPVLNSAFLTLNAANTYSGTTTIQSGNLLAVGSVLSGVAGPLGLSTTAIIIGNALTLASTSGGAGPNAILYMQGATGTTNITLDRNIDSSASANVVGRNDIGFNGSTGATNTLTVSGNWALSTTASRQNGLWAQQVGQTLDFTGVISGGNSATSFRAGDYGQGVGNVRLSNASNSYASRTVVGAGTLLIAGNAAAASGVLGTNSGLTVGDFAGQGARALIDGAFTVGKTITLQDIGAANSWTLGGNQAVASSFTGNITPASLAYTATLSLSQVAGGTVSFSGLLGPNPNATFFVNVAKIDAGKVILTGNNTYDGTTTVNAGELVVAGNQTANGPTNGQFVVNNAGILTFGDGTSTNGSATAAGTIFVNNTGTVQLNKTNGGTISNQVASNPSATITLGGTNAAGTSNTFTGTAYTNGGTLAVNSAVAGATLAFTGGMAGVDGAIDIKATTLTVGGAGDTLIGGAGKGIDNSTGIGAVTKSRTGTLIYQANNAYTGITAIDAGAVRVDVAQTNSGTYYVGNGGTTTTAASLLLGGGGAGLSGGVTFNRSVVVNPGDGTNRTLGGTNTTGTNIFSGTVALDGGFGENRSAILTAATGGNVTFRDVISGAGQNIRKIDGGSVTLSGANTYTGTTTVDGGALKVDNDGTTTFGNITGSSAVDAITVNTGGTLLLTGAGTTDRLNNVAGVTLNAGKFAVAAGSYEGSAATVPGGGSNVVGLGLLTLSASSTLDFDLSGNGSLLAFSGFASGGFTLNITNWTNATYNGTTNSGLATDDRLVFSTALSGGDLALINFGPGLTATQMQLGGSGFFEIGVTPVPEPSSVATAIGLLGLVGWRGRRNARAVRIAERMAHA